MRGARLQYGFLALACLNDGLMLLGSVLTGQPILFRKITH